METITTNTHNETPSKEISGNYWSNRKRTEVSMLEFFRKSHVLTYISGSILPMRFGNEMKVLNWLKKIKPENVLDIACGVGKIQIPTLCENAVGIDIPGYPKDSILNKRYKKALEYAAPDYDFSLSDFLKPNVITIINLNAHIATQTFFSILNGALKNTNQGKVYILMINEYNGNNLSYSLMKKLNAEKFRKMVDAQQHDYFSTRKAFISSFKNQFPQLKTESSVAVATFPPLIHWWAYLFNNKSTNYFEKGVSPLLNALFLVLEIPIGILDSLYMKLFPKKALESAYICGHLFSVEKNT
jgi:2-polyprenyl-3-methyl-5-hydroxy-6-metoxy-1,4-benzoquinol methylase